MGDFDATLSAAQAGAEWAVADLYRCLQPQLLRYLRTRVGADAEDVAAQTWLEAARGLSGFRGGESDLRSWLFTIARRRAADERRRRRRRPIDLVPGDVLAEVLGPSGVEDEAELGDLGWAAVRRIVASLPEIQAEVVLLRVVAGLPVDEVARIVGRPPGTVRVLQHRALRRLAETLAGQVQRSSGPV